MPQINILNVLQGDNQSTVVDKINYNFDQILSAGGGPQGQQGLLGPTGAIGPQGANGVQGSQGASGTKWFVQDLPPDISNITGSNPWTFPTLGDYWLDPDSANQDVYVFTATGWTNTGYGLAAGDIFQKITPIDVSGGGTGQGIFISGTASNQSLVLSDNSVNAYTPGGSGISNINFENAKLKIATENSRTKILSFGRADYDITAGGSGTTGIQRNPSIDWDASASGSTYYDITLNNPGGAIGIKSTSPAASGGVNLYANGEITAQSASDNITLQTDPANKGVFINTANNGGFLEFNTVIGSINQANAPLFANVIGVGIGVGTGGFKQTGYDSRKLSVLGNTSISKTPSLHTSSLFIGTPSTPNYDKGNLFVEGHVGFGATGSTGDLMLGISTTGMAEAQGRFPQLWVTSPNYGPGVQIRTKGSSTYAPRTIIGDGVWDFASAGGITGLAGTGPDITQEFYSSGGYSFNNGPLISYQHKISTPTNTTGTAPVFSVTTYVNSGIYGVNTVAKTLIQSKNSNRLLEIMANGTGGINRINMGAASSPLFSVVGPSGGPTGGVIVGVSASTYQTLGDALTGSVFTSLSPPVSTGSRNIGNHSLYVTGIQTIGTNNPLSLFNLSGQNNSLPVAGNSLLKIARNLYTTTTPGGSFRLAAGDYPGNYPNGLEITSYKSSGSGTVTTKNGSVAIAVGATSRIYNNSTSALIPANTTGFFVSDTGEKVSIGQFIDDFAAFGVSGGGPSTAFYAIKAKGDVRVTGDLEVVGNVGVTGNASIIGDFSVTGDVSIVSNVYEAASWTKTGISNQSGGNSLAFNLVNNNTISTSITYVNTNYTNSVNSAAYFTAPSVNYDRILYINNGGNYAIGSEANIQISNDGGTTWRLLGRLRDAPRTHSHFYWALNAIIPAGCIPKITLEGVEGGSPTNLPNGSGPGNSFGVTITLMKFGK